MTGAANHRGTSKQDYATPPKFIAAVERRFGEIAFDLAASPDNAKASLYYTEDDDSLSQDWTQHKGLLWLNPPFANIAPWAKKCSEWTTGLVGGRRDFVSRLAFLVPASVDSNWHRDHVHERALVLFCNGRLSFDGKGPFPKPCMLCVYGGGAGYDVWRWRESSTARRAHQAPLFGGSL